MKHSITLSVAAALMASLCAFSEVLESPVSGVLVVPTSGVVTNVFLFSDFSMSAVFGAQMDGGASPAESDAFLWSLSGGDAVGVWKVASPGHPLDGALVSGTNLSVAVPVEGVPSLGDVFSFSRRPGSDRGGWLLCGTLPASLVPSNSWFLSASTPSPAMAGVEADFDVGSLVVAASNATPAATVLWTLSMTSVPAQLPSAGWELSDVVPEIADGLAVWETSLPQSSGLVLYLVKDAAHDADGDGIPDAWEAANGLNPLSAADAALDPDGDGLDNLFEFQNGLDPSFFDLDPRRAHAGLVMDSWFFSASVASLACLTSAPPNERSAFLSEIDFPSTNVVWQGFDSRYKDRFGLRFDGFIRIDEPGTYVFHLASDDGSALYVAGERRTLDDGTHAFRWRSASVPLDAGWHPFRIDYFENNSSAGLVLEWTPPGGVRETVPASVFGWMEADSAQPPNVTVSVPPKTYAPGNNVPVAAEAWDFAGSIVSVDFLEGGTNLLAHCPEQPYTFLWRDVPPDSPSVVAVARNSFGKTAAATCIVETASAPEAGYAHGLDAAYHLSATPLNSLPDFSNSVPLAVAAESDVSAPVGEVGMFGWPSDATNNFASAYEGWIEIRIPGEYEFSLGSDDGSRLWIDGGLAVDANVAQAITARNVLCALGAGYHRIRVEYFQKGGLKELWLKWKRPGDWRLSLVPPPAFYRALGPSVSADSDGDGMVDWWEANFGLDPSDPSDAALDPDGDGLPNLAEYGLGTNPLAADTDLDGIPDAWEASHGLNPLLKADGALDPDGDGASNAVEHSAGTDVANPDTDGDGVPDGEEILFSHSDPLAADYDGTVTTNAVLNPADIDCAIGSWTRSDEDVRIAGRAGTVFYTNDFLMASAGLRRLDLTATVSAEEDTELICRVDGIFSGSRVFPTGESEGLRVSFLTPWLEAGPHEVSLEFRSFGNGASFAFGDVAVCLPGGPDADGNGRPDWLDARLAWSRPDRRGAVSSKVSPFCMTGRALFPELVRVCGAPALPLPSNGWWRNVPLSPASSVPVEVSFENGGRGETVAVEWSPTDVLTSPDVAIRAGDSLLLSGCASVGVSGATNCQVIVSGATPFLFADAGVYSLVPFDAGGAPMRAGPMLVRVLAGELPSELPAWKGKVNTLPVPGVSADGVEWTIEDGFHVDAFDPSGAGLAIDVPRYSGSRAIAARIANPDASVLCSSRVAGFDVGYTLDGIYHANEILDDGTAVVVNRISGFDLPDGIILRMKTQSGVCYEDGTADLDLSPDDFDETGDLYYRFFVPPGLTNPCQFLHILWNGKEIAQ